MEAWKVTGVIAVILGVIFKLNFGLFWWICLLLGCVGSIYLASVIELSESGIISSSVQSHRSRFYSFEKLKPELEDVAREKRELPAGVKPLVSEIIDLVIKDFVLTWYEKLVTNSSYTITERLKDDMMYVCCQFSKMLSEVDWLDFIADDVPTTLQQHLQNVERARSGKKEGFFVLHECAKHPEKETEHLYVLSKLICKSVLPSDYNNTTRDLLAGILTTQVLKPMIASLSKPDNINQSVLSYMKYHESLVTNYKRTFTYAESYEDFVQLIQKCDDIDQLVQIRYHIITEMMHATTLRSLKRQEDLDQQSSASQSVTSGRKKQKPAYAELLQNRDLKRYVNQLKIAKGKCEQRIANIGGEEYAEYGNDSQTINHHSAHKIISFRVALHNLECRGCFHSFLKSLDSQSLLEYWVACETLKTCDVLERHRLASEIFNTFIKSSMSLVRPDKYVIKQMEAFLIGNQGPEAFYEAQELIYHQLEEKYYPQFLVSDVYHRFIISWDATDSNASTNGSAEDMDDGEDFQDIDDMEGDILPTHSEYIRHKLSGIDSHIFNKTQAIEVLKNNRNRDISSQKNYEMVIKEIEKELDTLKFERRSLEAHQEQVDAWWRNIGFWNACAIGSEVEKIDGEWIVYFVIVIRLAEHHKCLSPDKTGWVISRTLQTIKGLFQELVELNSDLYNVTLPSKVRLGKPTEEYLTKSKTQVNDFLNLIMSDMKLCQSGALFDFVSTHPHLSSNRVRTTRSILKAVPQIFKKKGTVETEQSLLFFSENDDVTKEAESKDSIAGPVYSLLAEIFNLKGFSMFLRKTLVQIIQVTYGKSINRQIRETMNWLISENMLVYYLRFWKDYFWPGGVLALAYPPRTPEDQKATKLEALSALLENVPDVVVRLFGEKSSKNGLIKLFETFQDESLNKHYLYILMSKLNEKLIPEIFNAKQEYQMRLRNSVTEEQKECSGTTKDVELNEESSKANSATHKQDLAKGHLANDENITKDKTKIYQKLVPLK